MGCGERGRGGGGGVSGVGVGVGRGDHCGGTGGGGWGGGGGGERLVGGWEGLRVGAIASIYAFLHLNARNNQWKYSLPPLRFRDTVSPSLSYTSMACFREPWGWKNAAKPNRTYDIYTLR